jgi:hypothetical protein
MDSTAGTELLERVFPSEPRSYFVMRDAFQRNGSDSTAPELTKDYSNHYLNALEPASLGIIGWQGAVSLFGLVVVVDVRRSTRGTSHSGATASPNTWGELRVQLLDGRESWVTLVSHATGFYVQSSELGCLFAFQASHTPSLVSCLSFIIHFTMHFIHGSFSSFNSCSESTQRRQNRCRSHTPQTNIFLPPEVSPSPRCSAPRGLPQLEKPLNEQAKSFSSTPSTAHPLSHHHLALPRRPPMVREEAAAVQRW